jgi:quercetin dioxygenase-like cupin family protein
MDQRTVTFYRWSDMPKEKVTDMLDRRLITGDRMMLSHVFKEGAIVPRHSHENEQLTYILEGGLRFGLAKTNRR